MLTTWGHVSLDPADTQRRVGTVLRRHRLRVQAQTGAPVFRASLEHLGDDQLAVTRLSYGAAVVVEPVPEPGFWVLSLPLQGQVDVAAETGVVDSRPGVASLIPSDGEVRGHWHGGTRQAVLRIREALLWEACTGVCDDPDRFLRAASPTLRPGAETGLLAGMLQTLAGLDFKSYAGLPGSATQWASLAQLMAGAVVSARLQGEAPAVLPSGSANRWRRARQLVHDMVYAEEPISVGALAARLGISMRSLQALCQAEAGMTVVQAVREVRLLRARELLRAGHRSVSDAALACGFHHLGRFAALYTHRFGCLPSQDGRS